MSAVALLRFTAALEGATAAGLIFLPAWMLGVLFGRTPEAASSLILARLFGAPLVSLSFACWAASNDHSRRAMALQVAAMFMYNVIVAVLLVYAGTTLGLAGVALWPAVVAHGSLALWCVIDIYSSVST